MFLEMCMQGFSIFGRFQLFCDLDKCSIKSKGQFSVHLFWIIYGT